MTYRDFDRGRGGQMDWDDQGNGFRGQSGRERHFGGQSEYGGWGGRGSQGDYGGQGYAGPWQARGEYGGQFGREGEPRYSGGPGMGRSTWRTGGYESGDEEEFGRWRGGERFGREEMRGWRGEWQPEYGETWRGQGGYQGGPWEQRPPRRGTWGQGPAGGFHSRPGEASGWEQGFGGQGYGGRWSGGPREEAGQRAFGGSAQWSQEYGRQARPGASFVYEEVWFIPGPHTGRGPRGYQRSDARIEEDICERLTQHGQLDASDIQVQVDHGEVTLTGTVESRQAKRLAEDLLDSIAGIKDVHNQLRVQQPGQSEMSARGGQESATQDRAQSRNQSQRNEKTPAAAGTP